MKQLIAITLALCLSASSVHAQTNTNTQPKSVLVWGFALGGMAVGLAYIVYVYETTPGPKTPVNLVLWESLDGKATWHSVSTNWGVVLNGAEPIEIFRKENRLSNEDAFYKATLLK